VCLQVGVIEDTENRERLSKLLRFHSSKSETDMVGLQEYVGRMKEGQKGIYYMVRHCAGAAAAAAAAAAWQLSAFCSPLLHCFHRLLAAAVYAHFTDC
jgi:HSP90 family molecular chaperone